MRSRRRGARTRQPRATDAYVGHGGDLVTVLLDERVASDAVAVVHLDGQRRTLTFTQLAELADQLELIAMASLVGSAVADVAASAGRVPQAPARRSRPDLPAGSRP